MSAPFSGCENARRQGKRQGRPDRVKPEFQTTNRSSPITGIQWKRRLKSARRSSFSYCANPRKSARVLNAYSSATGRVASP